MKNLKTLLIALVASTFTTSCLVDDESNPTFTPDGSAYVVGFDNATATESYFMDEGAIEKSYPLSLKGSPTGLNNPNEIVINYTMDPASTAVEGAEFDFVDASGELIIDADSDFALLPISINTGGFDPAAPTELILNISTSAENTIVSEQYQTLTIKFVGCLATVDSYASYNLDIEYTAVDGSVSYYNRPAEVLSSTGSPNNFITSTSGHWGPGALSPGADGFYFSVICDEVFIESQNLGGYWANMVEGNLGSSVPTGTVDPVTGVINMEYKICYAGDCRKYVSVYTPN